MDDPGMDGLALLQGGFILRYGGIIFASELLVLLILSSKSIYNAAKMLSSIEAQEQHGFLQYDHQCLCKELSLAMVNATRQDANGRIAKVFVPVATKSWNVSSWLLGFAYDMRHLHHEMEQQKVLKVPKN